MQSIRRNVFDADGVIIGIVDHVSHGRIKLSNNKVVPVDFVREIDNNKVRLSVRADALFGRDRPKHN
jgi:hypothetical protein